MIRFAHPWWLALLPLLLLVLWHRRRPQRRPTLLFSSLDDLRRLPRTGHQRVRAVLPLLEVLGLACLVVAGARPQSGHRDETVTTEGVAIQLAIDRSDSMGQRDLDPDPFDRDPVSRLDVVKDVVRDFVDEGGDLPGRPHDLVGLVSFAGYVQVHCPLTLDHWMVLSVLDHVDVPEARSRDPDDREVLMTAMGDALVMAIRRMQEVRAESRVVILLSDGRSNIGVATPESAAADAAEQGIKVYTVGIGTAGRGLDEETLEEVAETAGGRYFNARSAADVEEVYRRIDELERSEIEAWWDTAWNDVFPWFLWAGLGLLAVHRLLADTRYRSLP